MAGPGQAGSQLLMLQQQQQHSQLLLTHGQAPQGQLQAPYGRSPQGSSPPTGQENTTTSEDSDDSTPHSAMVSIFMLFASLPRLRLDINLPRRDRNSINLVEDILLSFKGLLINCKTGSVRTEGNIEEPSCNHCCSKCYIYGVCVCNVNHQYAVCLRHIMSSVPFVAVPDFSTTSAR
jgi:hypothetical protein